MDASIAATQQELLIRAEKRELKTLREDEARHRMFLETITAHMQRMPSFTAPVLSPVPSVDHDEETAVLVISDVHVGKWVDPAEVGDAFGYNVPEFERRIANLKRRFDSVVDIQRRAIPIRKLYVLMLGDLVDGSDMRPGQKIRVDATVGAQTLIFVRHFAPFLTELAMSFDEVRVIVVGGNHGRVGKPGDNKPVDNFDVMAGHFLEVALQNVENVKIHVSHKPYEIARIGGQEVYMAHGEATGGAGGFAGVPAYGVAKAAARDVGLHRRLFDAYVVGHFHNAQDLDMNGIPVLINGAWDGGDAFSVNRLKLASTPAQWVFGVSPKRGITWRYRLHPAKPKRDASPIFDFDAPEVSV